TEGVARSATETKASSSARRRRCEAGAGGGGGEGVLRGCAVAIGPSRPTIAVTTSIPLRARRLIIVSALRATSYRRGLVTASRRGASAPGLAGGLRAPARGAR